MLSDTDRGFLRDLLHGQLSGLLGDAARTVAGMNGDRVEFPDPTDRAALECDRSCDLRIRDRERQLIREILEALERIQSGTFGVCEECDTKITVERLRARPMTTLCVDCKAEQEAAERLRRRALRLL